MNRLILTLAFAGGLGLLAPVARAGCNDPDLETVRDEVLAACPCNGNHGQYVSCVAREVRERVPEILDVNCKGKVVRCAARSTCGKKETFRTCAICDPGTCTDGFCDDPARTACIDSTTCPPVLRRCTTKSSEEHCLAAGGIPGTGSCCQASCLPPG